MEGEWLVYFEDRVVGASFVTQNRATVLPLCKSVVCLEYSVQLRGDACNYISDAMLLI